MELIGLPLEILAPSALAGLAVLLVLTGRLVPRTTLNDERHEKNEWRAECRVKDQTIQELAEQNQAMLNAFGPTLTDFLDSLRRAGVGATLESGDDQ